MVNQYFVHILLPVTDNFLNQWKEKRKYVAGPGNEPETSGSLVRCCYSIYYIAEDHIHTDLTCNIEEPQQKYRLGKVSNRFFFFFWGGAGGGGA